MDDIPHNGRWNEQTGGTGALSNMRNLFAEYGYTGIEERLQSIWHAIFFGEEKFYYEVADMGYVVDTGNSDVRSEGQSYAMMCAVQMNDKNIFDRVWKWSKTYMWMDYGKHAGYFAWSVSPEGVKNSHGPAPDGEEFFAMALFFAANRWGSGEGIFDYAGQAREILHHCRCNEFPMWNPDNKLIKFVPEMEFSDPSYHLPHFYELFAKWANPEDREFWKEAAAASREYLKLALHPETGLNPEYANYDGTPNHFNEHGFFYSDAYRTATNIGLDSQWHGPTPELTDRIDKLQAFFLENDLNYIYEIDGTKRDKEILHPVGLIAATAAASLAASGKNARIWVDKFWNTPLRSGNRRYYDNFLYLFAFLALSGNYKIWEKQ